MNSQIKPNHAGVISPARSRGAATQKKLVSATLDLLKEHAFEELTVADITRRAGVATGTFYRRFQSKEAMLPLLYEAYDEIYAKWSSATLADRRFLSPDLPDRLDALIATTWAFYEKHCGLLRALHLNSRLSAEIVTEGATERRARHYQTIEALLGDEVDDARRRRLAGRQIAFLMISAVNEYVLYPTCTPAAASKLSRNAVKAALVAAACGVVASAAR